LGFANSRSCRIFDALHRRVPDHLDLGILEESLLQDL